MSHHDKPTVLISWYKGPNYQNLHVTPTPDCYRCPYTTIRTAVVTRQDYISGREADLSSLLTSDLKKSGALPPFPIRLHGVQWEIFASTLCKVVAPHFMMSAA